MWVNRDRWAPWWVRGLGPRSPASSLSPRRLEEVPLEVLRQRESKWLDMLNNWDKWMAKKHKKVGDPRTAASPQSLGARPRVPRRRMDAALLGDAVLGLPQLAAAEHGCSLPASEGSFGCVQAALGIVRSWKLLLPASRRPKKEKKKKKAVGRK